MVEDNPTNQMVAMGFLEKLGLNADLAENGLVAVDKAGKAHFDVILMGLQTPEMDGFEAARLIRASGRNAAVPIIALTAAAMLKDRQDSEAAGMTDFVSQAPNPVTTVVRLPNRQKQQAFEVPGLNLNEAAIRMAHNWDLLRATLVCFARDFSESGRELDAQLADGRIKDAQRLAHTVAGLSKSIGAADLAELGEMLANSAFVRPELMDELSSHLKESTQLACFEKLKSKVEAFDYIAANPSLAALASYC